MVRSYEISESDNLNIKRRFVHWASHNFSHFALFQNHDVTYPYGGFQEVLYASSHSLSMEEIASIDKNDPLIGLISYDFKNNIEKLGSENRTVIDLPDDLFFVPEISVSFTKNQVIIMSTNPDRLYEEVVNWELNPKQNHPVMIKKLTSREEYENNVQSIKNHILEGDIYEMNYCMGFEFEANWDPIQGYFDLVGHSPMPFSALFHAAGKYVLCASPERFLKVENEKVIAQPIKGTIRRSDDKQTDEELATQLFTSEKERAENLMIVDLMRNDLSKIAQTGSVAVEELFGVYPFPKVHQMISTVSARLNFPISFRQILSATFPMGSMTGAPKIKCMELIERYENFKRGWFSGSLGYILPDGNMDWNVIIRSIIYDSNSNKGYFAVGSAITSDADAAYEYEECMLKASAIISTLESPLEF
ncbi:anthranilate synthase component I family protein [Belliella kenyensis]|uniref:Anthranilate synthase component I family protein n=1 Tax=Belliella kenyensis TaxID=1472724 RepID=A0ABV8EN03_9BACT|nr:anthranilate synthase component I family protein [Belliella kenyensis]MCH7403390.1 anthranilate synthase component I family protein [Belliella kenyensis]MDN3601602.1 anthranilate synthase component I family protein [Belliella kenyensis]